MNVEQLRRIIEQIAEEVLLNLDCKNTAGDGSDELCDGEDCLHCWILHRTAEALET